MEKTLAKRSWLDKLFGGSMWNSHIKSANVTGKEMWLGYVIGPFGNLMLQSVVLSYFNMYLTDVLGFTVSKGAIVAAFMVIFPIATQFVDAITNMYMSKMMDTVLCKQGKVRPWLLMSIPFIIVSVLMMFWTPNASVYVQMAWVTIAYLLFDSVAYTMWYMPYQMSAPLATRNVKQRSKLAMAGTITKNMGAGFISILFPTIVSIFVTMLGGPRYGYLACMSVMCCVMVPLTFIQYFYTRERVTEERRNQLGTVEAEAKSEPVHTLREASMMDQFKACLKDKYWVILLVMVLLYQVINGMRTVSTIYYSGWVVNGNAYGEAAAIQAKFQMIALSPMGPGLLLFLPLVKKFGRSKVIQAGSILTAVGSMVAFMMAGNSGAVYGGTALAGIGAMSFMFCLTTFIGDAIDHVEWKTGVRVDGITTGIIGVVHCLSNGLGQALFNLGLNISKYAQPEVVGSFLDKKGNEILTYADQSVAATNWINFTYQGTYIFVGVLFVVMFTFFFKLERDLPSVSKDLQQKKIDECAALGIEYVPAHERERREIEAQQIEAENNRIAELKEYCAKKGLDFDTENQKHLDKVAKKAAKKAARKAKKAKK